jgi:capsular exopolysaccharide synthesis family protein
MRVAEQLVSLVAPSSVEADQYRALRHTIERMHRDAKLQVIAVTSPGAGEGKTVTTLNLASSLAQSPDTRVLVIDADLHRPSVGFYLGIDSDGVPGLADVIRNDSPDFGDSIHHIEPFNLSVVLAGDVATGAYELLNSARMELLLAEARKSFDYVLIDTPPVVPLPDSRLLTRWVDGFLIVVAAHKTPRKALAEALSLVDSAKTIGMVFNGDDRPLSPYSSYYGYYGRRDDASPARESQGVWSRSRKSRENRT